MDAFLVVGSRHAELVRFAVSRSSVDAYGWNACMSDAWRRLERGERDFCIAPAQRRVEDQEQSEPRQETG
jgi:hypothetical protein